jgi:hypothetical protein
MTKSLKMRVRFTVAREVEKSTGYRNLCIKDARGVVICNMVGQLDDSEEAIARAICKAVNAAPVR